MCGEMVMHYRMNIKKENLLSLAKVLPVKESEFLASIAILS